MARQKMGLALKAQKEVVGTAEREQVEKMS